MKIRPLHDRILVKRLDEETKTAGLAPQPSSESGTISRVVGVEPAKNGASATTETPSSVPAPSQGATPGEAETKVATAESKDTEQPKEDAGKSTEAPVPESATRKQLAQDMLAELAKLGCYFGSINADWGARSKLALDPPTVTAVVPVKFCPFSVTTVPAGPRAGCGTVSSNGSGPRRRTAIRHCTT